MRKLTLVIIVNLALILLFVIANYGIWNMVNGNHHLGHTVMNPIAVIEIMSGDVFNGSFVGLGTSNEMLNFPFWLFFLSIAVNLYFIVKLSKEPKKDNQSK